MGFPLKLYRVVRIFNYWQVPGRFSNSGFPEPKARFLALFRNPKPVFLWNQSQDSKELKIKEFEERVHQTDERRRNEIFFFIKERNLKSERKAYRTTRSFPFLFCTYEERTRSLKIGKVEFLDKNVQFSEKNRNFQSNYLSLLHKCKWCCSKVCK